MNNSNAFLGHLRHHNRPTEGIWYLKSTSEGGDMYYHLSHPSRLWKDDPSFKTGDLLVVIDFEASMRGDYRLPGWNVSAVGVALREFKFFWVDDTAWRSVWER